MHSNLPTHLQPRARELEAEIRRAFAGVTREGGVSWSEAEVIDDYGTDQDRAEARARDRDRSWEELVDDEDWWHPATPTMTPFLDAIGYRYYLPAMMIRALRGPSGEFLAYSLTLHRLETSSRRGYRGFDIDELNNGLRERWGILSASQSRAVAQFVRLMHEVDEWHDDGCGIRDWLDAYRSHWHQFDPDPTPISGSDAACAPAHCPLEWPRVPRPTRPIPRDLDMPTFVHPFIASLAIAVASFALAQPNEGGDSTNNSEWPGFDAPAAELVELIVTRKPAELGLDRKTTEQGFAEQVRLRPQEFADAILDAIPDGYQAIRALKANNEAFAASLKPVRGLPHMTKFMPPEVAAPTLSAIQRKAAMIEWCLGELFDRATDGRCRAGKMTPEDEAANSVLSSLAYEYSRIRGHAERVALETRLDISPTIEPFPGKPIDLDKRNSLITVCNERFDADPQTPIGLPLEEFFDGNTEHNSIAPNLWFNHPGIECFRDTLEAVRARPGVIDVRVSVHEWPEPDEPQWIAAESVFVWTREADADSVREWLAVLRPDVVGECPPDVIPSGGPELETGTRVIGVNWD